MTTEERTGELIQELREHITVLKEENMSLRQQIHQLEAKQGVSENSRSLPCNCGICRPINPIGPITQIRT